MTDQRHLRRRLLLLGVVPLLASGALGLKVGWMEHHNDAGATALASDAGEARRAYATSSRVNVLEPWVAPYDEGVAAFVQGQATDAVALFERALGMVPAEQECRVRTNLALAKELQADAAGPADLARARLTWLEGRQVLEDCLTAGAQGVEPEIMARVDARLARKLADAARALEVDPPEPGPTGGAFAPAKELERFNAEAREIRRRYRYESERPGRPRTSEGPVYMW